MQIEHPKRETLPLRKNEIIMVTVYNTVNYNVPLHYHTQFELHFITGAKGLQSIAGNKIFETGDIELVLVGPNLKHAWKQYPGTDKKAKIVVVNFDKEELSKKQTLNPDIESLLQHASRGILFSKKTSMLVAERLLTIVKLKKKTIIREIISLLTKLANDHECAILNTGSTQKKPDTTLHDIERYLKDNYNKKLLLEDMCLITGKSPTSFNRYIKELTGTTFVNYLNNIRVAFATRSLCESDLDIAEIARATGFNNIANFNRAFKKSLGITPLRYREIFYGSKIFF